MGTKALSKSEFMAMATNHYYKKRLAEKEIARQAENYIIGNLSTNRDRRLKKRGF